MKLSSLLSVTGLFVALVGCGNDNTLNTICGTEANGFDITEASTLQDAQGYYGMHDAVILSEDISDLGPDEVWRVRSVEIMPMMAQSEFDFYADGQSVTVEVFDGASPLTGQRYSATQTFRKDELEWTDVTLSNADSVFDPFQKQAWWRFPFEDTIPTSGMASTDYVVSVVWDSAELPTVGYSNYNRPCSKNWTDYADGFGWGLNEGGDNCSWPMLRVNIEILKEASTCEGESYDADG